MGAIFNTELFYLLIAHSYTNSFDELLGENYRCQRMYKDGYDTCYTIRNAYTNSALAYTGLPGFHAYID